MTNQFKVLNKITRSFNVVRTIVTTAVRHVSGLTIWKLLQDNKTYLFLVTFYHTGNYLSNVSVFCYSIHNIEVYCFLSNLTKIVLLPMKSLGTFTKKILYGPLLWMEFKLPQGYRATTKRQFIFYHSVPRSSWYLCYRPQKDKRLSQPWNHRV